MAASLDTFETVMTQILEESSHGMIRLERKGLDFENYYLYQSNPADIAKSIREAFELTVMKEIALNLQGGE